MPKHVAKHNKYCPIYIYIY